MSDEDIPMAQCGACNSIIPLNSESCPVCNVKFSGIAEQELGECGACGAIIPADSTSCSNCGAVFVETEVPSKTTSSTIPPTGRKVKSDETTTKQISEDSATTVINDDHETIRDDIEESQVESYEEDIVNEVTETQDLSNVEELEEESIQKVVEPQEQLDAEEIEEESIQDVVEPEADASPSELDETNEQEDIAEVSIDDSELTSDESEPEISEQEMNEEDISEEGDSEDDTSEDASVEHMMDGMVDDLETEELVEETVEEDGLVEVTVEEDDLVEETVEEDDLVEETVEEDDLVEETVEEDDLVDETVEEETLEEKEPETPLEESEIVMAFENLALAIAAKGMTASEAFGEIDSSDDNLIDAPELQKGIENIAGERLTPKHVTAILKYLDTDGDRRVDPNELVKALEDMKIGIQPGDIPKVKTFPSPLQKFLMGKKANDIFYPIAYFLMVTFIGLWVVNGMGLLVDGSGGNVVYDGGTDQWGGEITEANWNLCESDAFDEMIDPCRGTVSVGETYPCDPALDPNKCQNSLTPFSGEKGASSMPAGFYGDGIFMIVAGLIGLGVIAYLHLKYAPSLRKRAKKGDSESDDEENSEEDSSENDDEEPTEDEYDEESVLEAPAELEIADESEEDDDGDFEDEIDVGDWIGLEVDGEEFFGEIIEFDDDEGLVIIETEDGEEITGDQDDMFLDDE